MTPADYLRKEFGEIGELVISLNLLHVKLTRAMDEISDLMSEIATTQARLLQKSQTREAR